MKVGIISINAHTKVLNFASPLHSYAFQQFLLQNGIDSIIIDYFPNYYKNFNVKYPLLHYIKNKSQNKKLQKRRIRKWTALFFSRIIRYNKIQRFIDQYYIKTDDSYDEQSLNKFDLGLDCYICATDVIWKYNKKSGFDKGFFLACNTMKNKRKIAYAASRGASSYTKKQQKLFIKNLSSFDFIAVRERSLQEYIHRISDLNVTHVLDPVLLHEKEFYHPLIKHPRRKKKGYVLIYIVMERSTHLVKMAVEFAKKNDLDVIELSDFPQDSIIPRGTYHRVIYGIGIEEWLGYIDDAEYVFTNSFHATCFSILFEKQFFVGKRNGDKITSLLEMFGLTNRLLFTNINGNKTYIEVKKINQIQDIDYVAINILHREYIQSSAKYLIDALKDID